MPISIVIGGQFGSEGKGKVAHYFAKSMKAHTVVRVGGPNSGHTVIGTNDKKFIFKMLPTASILDNVMCILTSGSYIDTNILFHEIKLSGLPLNKLKIDPYAVIISKEILEDEINSGRRDDIGSTNSGTGAAVANRVLRNKKILFAKDDPQLKPFISFTKEYLREDLEKGKEVIIEGTQGFGLSVLHSELHPYVTSRDTSAAGFLSETGLSPLDVQNVIMVIRAFPIRVPGKSGPLENETTWEAISSEAGGTKYLREYTSVTNALRRVAYFDSNIVNKAVCVNRPNIIVLNHVDYIDHSNASTVSKKTVQFVKTVEKMIDKKIDFIGLDQKTIIPMRY